MWLKDFDAEAFVSQLMGSGSFKCRCGAKLTHPGVCDACDERIAKENMDRALEGAMESIPMHFRWARFDSELMPQRIAHKYIAQAREAADLLHRLGQSVVLVGKAGSGKTSLACAILRHVAAQRGSHAWRCRFVPALEVAASRGDYGARSVMSAEAIGASCIVLDDIGQEAEADRIRITEVMHARHDASKPTIVTTCYEPAVIAARYGGGVDRRVFEGASLIMIGGA